MKIAITSLAATLAALVALTWWALESSGVATLETRTPDGTARATHVWFAESNGELWLEAGTPENGWYVDVQKDPRVGFSADGVSGRFVARPIPGPMAHVQIRSLLRERYGWRDRWVALLFDTSRSVAVRLEPEPVPGRPPAPNP